MKKATEKKSHRSKNGCSMKRKIEWNSAGKDYVGEVILRDIGIPDEAFFKVH